MHAEEPLETTFTVRLRADQVGMLNIHYRGTLGDKRDPVSGAVDDQQGYFVKELNLPIIPEGQPEYEIVSTTFDKSVYQNGVDTAHVTVVMRSNWGSDDGLSLSVELRPSRGPSFLVGTQTFTLGPGEEHMSLMQWAVPDTSYAWEFDAVLTLSSSAKRFVILGPIIDPDKFVGTPVPSDELEFAQQELRSHWEEDAQCVGQMVTNMNGASTGEQLRRFSDQMGVAGDLHRAGRTKEGWSAVGAGLLEFVRSAVSVFGLIWEPMSVTDVYLSGGLDARGCVAQWYLGGGMKRSYEGVLIDSLAVWVRTGVDSVAADISDAVLIEGGATVLVEADSGWASADSVFLNVAEFATVDTTGLYVLLARNSHRCGGSTEDNPRSLARFVVRSEEAQALNIGLLHRTTADSLTFVRYPEFTVTGSSVVAVVVADSISVPILEVDLDGDGTVDFLWHPGAAGVEEQASQPGRGEPLLSLASALNPTAGASLLVLRSAASLKDVKVSVYDVAGREVRRLVVGDLLPGVRQVVWDGRADDGRRVASGIYQCVATHAGGSSRTMRLVVLR